MRNQLRKIRIIVERLYMFICNKIYKVDNSKIIFESFNGKYYSDNPRAISEKLHEMDSNLKLCWLLINKENKYNIIPNYIEKKFLNNWERLKEIATSKVYISNQGAYPNLYKSTKQLFIETWHGDRGFKKVLYDKDPNRTIKVYNNKVSDICIAGSKFGVSIYRSAFKYNGKILKVGSPRDDVLINGDDNRKKNILKMLGIKKQKVLLYAPTFRDKMVKKQNINIDLNNIRKVLNTKTNDEWVVLVRCHHVSKGFNYKFDNYSILNVSDYPDMADLLLISDILITDYSSSALDFCLTKKPVVLFISDYFEYKNNCRDFCVDPREIGLFYAQSEDELVQILLNKSEEDFKKAAHKAIEYYETNETGHSSEIICKEILKFINKQ